MSDYKEWVPHESKDYPDSYEDSCWNNDPNRAKYKIRETDTVVVYKDKFPACDGHLLFIPKINRSRYVAEAIRLSGARISMKSVHVFSLILEPRTPCQLYLRTRGPNFAWSVSSQPRP